MGLVNDPCTTVNHREGMPCTEYTAPAKAPATQATVSVSPPRSMANRIADSKLVA